MSSRPTVAIKTVGCRLNRSESATMAAQFENAGYEVVPFGRAADVVVVHGCAVTRNAERKSIRFARAAGNGDTRPFVVLAGCVIEATGGVAAERAGADLAAGRDMKFNLPSVLGEHGFPRPTASGSDLLPRFETARAWVKVQDGCNFNCTYCVVPITRGRPVSVAPAEVIARVRRLTAAGYRELVLTGANLVSYRHGDVDLVGLLQRIEAVEGIGRIRLSSIEMSCGEHRLIDYMAESSRLCRFLHLPLQSGSNDVLARMRRRYTAERFAGVVEYAVKKLGSPGLGTDLIVGFPGEDERAFESTFSMVRDLPLSNLHVFSYSPRPGTAAWSMGPEVDSETKKQRSARLIALGRGKRRDFTANFVGKEVSMLVEQVDKEGIAKGWTGEYLEARIRRPGVMPNTVVDFVPTGLAGSVLPALTSDARKSLA